MTAAINATFDLDKTSETVAVNLYLDDEGRCPDVEPADYDVLLTTARTAPAPWVSVANICASADALRQHAAQWPTATAVAMQLLKSAETLSFYDALVMESLSYSTLLGGREFKRWLTAETRQRYAPLPDDPVLFERSGEQVTLTLNDSLQHNPINRHTRDALVYYLDSCLMDPTQPKVILRAEGRSFSIGGALEEFGLANDLAAAHQVRMEQSVALRVHQLQPQSHAKLQGAVIGAGLEIAAAATRVSACKGTWFQLPELSMGLIPGAGGTVSISRRIGRHRCAYLLLSGRKINTTQALQWGLIDDITNKDNDL